jgi:hypothetical protein
VIEPSEISYFASGLGFLYITGINMHILTLTQLVTECGLALHLQAMMYVNIVTHLTYHTI